MEVAVCEAVTNSIEHGCAPPGEPTVVVKCHGWKDWLVVEVEDESLACSLPKLCNASDSRNERGRGVMIMRALMDECKDTRTDHGIRVRMAKQKAAIQPD